MRFLTKALQVAIDFDGTIVEHAYPDVGAPVNAALSWIRAWKEAGAKIYLWTMRDGDELIEAVQYCTRGGVEFDAVNTNISQKSWTDSPKLYAHVYVDDAAYGCPLIRTSTRPYVDWNKVGPEVMRMIIDRGSV